MASNTSPDCEAPFAHARAALDAMRAASDEVHLLAADLRRVTAKAEAIVDQLFKLPAPTLPNVTFAGEWRADKTEVRSLD